MAELGCRCKWCEETREAFTRVKFTIPGLCAYLEAGPDMQDEMMTILEWLEAVFNSMGGKDLWQPTEKSH